MRRGMSMVVYRGMGNEAGPLYVYRAYAMRVIDGDTYELDIDLGFHAHINVHVRLRGVDTPELNTTEGKQAKYFVESLMLDSQGDAVPLLVQTYKDHQSFNRWIADVWVAVEGQWKPLADEIIQAQHGVPYP